MDILYWYYVQSKSNKDTVGNIIKQIQDSGHMAKSRIAVIQQLLQQDIISSIEFDELMKYEDVPSSPSTSNAVAESGVESGVEISDTSSSNQPTDDIKVMKRNSIINQKYQQQLFPGLTRSIAKREQGQIDNLAAMCSDRMLFR